MTHKYVNEKIDKAYQEYVKQHYNKGIKSDVKTFLGVILGSTLIAFNMAILLPSANMIAAGFSGLIMLIQKISLTFFNFSISFTLLSILFNAFPAYLAYKNVGRKFTVFSCIAILLIAILTDLIPHIVITNDRLLISVFGGIINGFGGALILRCGACSGGTDFLSMFFSVKKGKNAFGTIFLCNSVLILLSGIIFGLDSALYTIIYQFVSTQMVKFLYNSFAKKTLLIVTEKPYEVSDAIMEATHHACTIFNSAEGSYSRESRHVVYTIISASEIGIVNKQVKGTDPDAFINTLNSESVVGSFFQRPIN